MRRDDDALAAAAEVIMKPFLFISDVLCAGCLRHHGLTASLVSGWGEVSMHICKAGSKENGKRSVGTSQHRRKAASCGLTPTRIS